MSDFPSSIEECETKLCSLWQEIGYTSNEKESQQKQIQQQIIMIFQHFIEQITQEKENLNSQIEGSINAYTNLSVALGKSPILPQNQDSSLRQQFNEVNIAYNKLYKESKDVIQKFKKIHAELSNNFARLGIPNKERGEFSSVGNKDLSELRYQRCIAKNKELIDEITERESRMMSLRQNIQKISQEIEEKVSEEVQQIFENNGIADNDFLLVKQFQEELIQEKSKRMNEMLAVGEEIMKLWNVLNISDIERQEFLSSHSTLGNEAIAFCKAEAERLNNIRLKELPKILASQQDTIRNLTEYTHTKPQVDITIDPVKEESKEEVYLIYEDEIKRLQALKEELGPMLDLVMQREMMLHEYEYLEQLFEQRSKGHSQGKYISPIENPKQIIKEENDFRRVKNMIPRLEKKLKLALLEYRAMNGHDFELDGEPYINKLSHIILSNLEISRSLDPRHKAKKNRKSMAPVIKQQDLIANPVKEVRRKSENCQMLSNLYSKE